jgi:hypothetical protein
MNDITKLSPLEQQFARLCRIAITVYKQFDAEVAPAPLPQCGVPEPAHDPIPVGIPDAPAQEPALDATRRPGRPRKPKVEPVGETPPVGAPAAPAAEAEPQALTADERKALRLELSDAVRASLAVNGEQETVRRLGYPKISMVPDNFLAAVIAAMKA